METVTFNELMTTHRWNIICSKVSVFYYRLCFASRAFNPCLLAFKLRFNRWFSDHAIGKPLLRHDSNSQRRESLTFNVYSQFSPWFLRKYKRVLNCPTADDTILHENRLILGFFLWFECRTIEKEQPAALNYCRESHALLTLNENMLS